MDDDQRSKYRSWGGSRGNRLPTTAYSSSRPLHVTICTDGNEPWLSKRRLAEEIAAIFDDHEETLAYCLMPDHVHWLLARASRGLDTVRRTKSFTTRVAWRHGHRGRFWQRSFWDRVVRESEDLFEVAEYLRANPVRAGLVPVPDEWPHQALFIDRIERLQRARKGR